MQYLEEIKEKLLKALEEMSKKGDISMADVEKIHKFTDTVKNIDKICALEEESGGYSERGSSYAGSSYARGRRNARRDRRGRYSYDMGYSEEGASYDEGLSGYSRHDAKDHMMMKLGAMMEEADPQMRESLKKCMRDIEQM